MRNCLLAASGFIFFSIFPAVIFAQDTDGDLMPDAWESLHGCLMANTADGDLDPDSDKLVSLDEYNYSDQMDPCDPDTDVDTVSDGFEVAIGSNPLDDQIVPDIWRIGSEIRISYDLDESESYYPNLVWSGSEYGLAYTDGRSGTNEIYFNRLAADGYTVGPDLRLTYVPSSSSMSTLIWADSEYAAAWMGYRSDNNEICFGRIGADGSTIGSEVRVTYDSGYSGYPSLASTGSPS